MGSSDSGAGAGTGPGLTDSSVGSIVWVRRRNGSWWPGKILGPDELSSTHLMSPRSGTPVKLLGREDASVDWYNLEKSKRVKAFRCGEFDDCIEKAEASLGLPAKKREKYARREDAILHALELEKEICLKKYGKPVTNNPLVKNNSSNSAAKDLATSTRTHGTGNGKNEAYELRKLHRKNDPSAESRRICSPQKARGGGCQGLLNSEFNPPTRGLQDSGVSIYQFNQMATSSVVLNGSREMTAVEQTHTLRTSSDADSGNSSGRAKGQMDGLHGYDHVMGSSSSCFVDSLPDSILPPVKRGRMSYMPSDSGDLVEIKSGPPSQVDAFASRPMEDITHSRPNGFAEDVSYGSSEDTESDSSETDCTEQAVDVEMNTFTDANTPLDPPTRLVNRLEMHDQHESSSCEDQDQDDLSLDGTHFSYQDPISLDTGISKWQLKGRRNVRSLPRKSVNRLKSRSSYSKAGGSPLIRSTNQNLSYYHNDVDCTNDFEFVEDDLGLGRERFDERRYLPNPHFGMRRPGSMGQRMIDMEELTWGSQSMGGGNWGQMGGSFSSFFGGWHGRDKLLDVDLKVEAHHQGGERVPWVSLMSRFNGKAIVGHPIQIEKLEDGSMNSILANLGCDYNQNRVDQPLWRTARRTANFRVPHPHTSSSHPYEDDEQYLDDQDQRSVLRTSTAMTLLSGNKNAGKRKYPHVHKPSSKKKMKKKTPDRSSLSSNHKIRHLSSIGMDQSGGSDPRNRSYSHILKPLDSEPPTVACIPLKLVFSRLLEAVGRPPSGPANHGFH